MLDSNTLVPLALALTVVVAHGVGVASAHAQTDDDDVRVDAIRFEGVEAFDASELRALMATRATGWLPWAEEEAFDREDFEMDLDRLVAFYHENGYVEARIAAFDVSLDDEGGSVELTIVVDEGDPETVEAVRLEGFDPLDRSLRQQLEGELPLRAGAVRTANDVQAAVDMAKRALQSDGLAYATVVASESEGATEDSVVITLRATPGLRTRFGEVSVNGNTSVSADVIRRQLAFTPGDRFRLSDLITTQRRLYDLQLFQFANVEPMLDTDARTDVPVRITVAESEPRQVRFSVGYGTEERERIEAGWQHRNFFGGARTVDFEAKWSGLDRGVRAHLAQPAVFGARQTLSLDAQRWFADEPAYELDTTGGRLSLTRDVSGIDPVTGRGADMAVAASLAYEYEDYAIANAALEDLSFRDDLIALGLDPRTGAGRGALVALAFDFRRSTTRDLLDASEGYMVTVHLEQAGAWLPGDFNYVELSGEGRHYLTLGRRAVLATRVRAGWLATPEDGLTGIPFFKRYFLGGSTNLRGWGRYEVSPLSGSGLPLGGERFVSLSAELRVAAWGDLGLVGFVDAGNAWADRAQDSGGLRYNVGPGLRYATPIGPVRVDLGYQLNPIEGLLVDGEPQPRRWRIHFSLGQAF